MARTEQATRPQGTKVGVVSNEERFQLSALERFADLTPTSPTTPLTPVEPMAETMRRTKLAILTARSFDPATHDIDPETGDIIKVR